MAETKLQKPAMRQREVNQDTLHWVVKHNTNFKDEDDFLESILIECGVKEEDIPSFLHPKKSMIHDPFLMKNMKEAVELVHKHVTKGSRIAIKVDVDDDGYTSSSILGQFLSKDIPDCILPEIQYIFSEGKEHGLTYSMIKNFTRDSLDLIIIPDASITVKEVKQILNNFDVDILVLDHHLVENDYYDTKAKKWLTALEAKAIMEEEPDRIKEDCYMNYVVACNCTDGQYPNPSLSGAGVVAKFIEAYEAIYPDDVTPNAIDQYLDLVATGISGDGMSLKPLENRYYVLEGLKAHNHKNQFLNEIEARFPDDFKFGRTITNTTWKIVPLVNGTIRFGKRSEIEDVFKAMLGVQEEREYQPRRKSKNDPKPPVEMKSLQWFGAKIADNVKSRQDTEVRKYVVKLDEKIKNEHLDDNSVIYVDGTGILEKSTVTGLIANKIASKYFRPVVVMKEFDATTFGGSSRGYDKGNIKDFKSFLEQVGVNAMGHANAAGVKFKKEDLPEIIRKTNELMPVEDLIVEHQVDWEIPARQLKASYVAEVSQNYEIWGNDIPEPTFAISNLQISASEINGYGENNGFIRFTYNGVPFVKKYCSREDYPRMICQSKVGFGKPKHMLNLNIIGQFVLSVYEDKVIPQVKILFFDSRIIGEGKGTSDDEVMSKRVKTEKITKITKSSSKVLTSKEESAKIQTENVKAKKGPMKKVAFDLDDDETFDFTPKKPKVNALDWSDIGF